MDELRQERRAAAAYLVRFATGIVFPGTHAASAPLDRIRVGITSVHRS
jgi:hypothetical protein